MASKIPFNISRSVLVWARESTGLSIEDASKKLRVNVDQLTSWENGLGVPTYRQLENLADTYKRPLAFLLLPAPPIDQTIKNDFRTLPSTQIDELKEEVRLSLRRAKRYQLVLDEVAHQFNNSHTTFKTSILEDPRDAARRFREFLDLPISAQKSWKTDDAFNNFQRKIEETGIYVFKMRMPMEQARAFCITGDHPVIVLNLNDSKNGRIFSLFHEVSHVLLNTNDLFSDSNFANDKRRYSEVEKFCDIFAASFLVPDKDFASHIAGIVNFNEPAIANLARIYNVSNEVIARKLLEIDLISRDFFWSKKHKWDEDAKRFKQKQNERLKEREGGISPGIKIIFEKGRPYVSSVINAYEQGLISSADATNYLETKISNLPKLIERLAS